MELYIPPPSSFLPRLPPPRPVVPAVPIVPIPDLPDTIHAPEGAYTLNPSLFPPIGTPQAPLPFENMQRPTAASSFIGGAGGFIVPPPNLGPPPGQTAMSFGSSVVNGQTQPGHPVKFSFVNVWFPPKGAAAERGLGGLLGMGGKGETITSPTGAAPQMTGYEPSVSSDSDSPPSSNDPPPPMEVPLAAIPQASTGKKNPWSKASSIPPNALSALPRPKNNLRSSNSTFVTRLQAADNLPKLMAERGKAGGELVRWGFWNLGRTFGWGEEGGKVKEPLARVTFSQVPTAHAVSQITASPERVDIVVGFSSGDLVWLDFILGRYTRINKGGLLNNTAVVSVNFDPRQPQHFIVAFQDSTIMQFNLFAEDPVTTISASPLPWIAFFDKQREMQVPLSPTVETPSRLANPPTANGTGLGIVNGGGSGIGSGNGNGNGSANGDAGTVGAEGEVYEDSMMIWKNEDWAQLQIPLGKKDEWRSPWAGKNPTAVTRIGRKSVTAMAFSPDGRFLATVSEDGLLRLIDTQEERLTDTFAAYFGPLSCVSWSPDSRFVAVGGQDDLVSIFSPRESRLVARCQGHSAFVTHIAFDPARGGGGGGYRFGSVGEDGKLLLWDFSAASLHRPRHHHSNASHHRLAQAQGSTISLAAQSRSHLPEQVNSSGGNFHVAPPRSEVALLQPVLARVVEGNLLTGIYMSPNAIVTVSRAALVKCWQRPPKQSASGKHRGSTGRERGEAAAAGGAGREGREREMRSTRVESVGVAVTA